MVFLRNLEFWEIHYEPMVAFLPIFSRKILVITFHLVFFNLHFSIGLLLILLGAKFFHRSQALPWFLTFREDREILLIFSFLGFRAEFFFEIEFFAALLKKVLEFD